MMAFGGSFRRKLESRDVSFPATFGFVTSGAPRFLLAQKPAQEKGVAGGSPERAYGAAPADDAWKSIAPPRLPGCGDRGIEWGGSQPHESF